MRHNYQRRTETGNTEIASTWTAGEHELNVLGNGGTAGRCPFGSGRGGGVGAAGAAKMTN